MTRVGKAQATVLEYLHTNATTHANNSNGLFVTHEFDPHKLLPYQTLNMRTATTNRRHIGERILPNQLEGLAGVIDKRYTNLDTDSKLGDQEIAYSSMGEFLRKRRNVALAQRHGEIRDVAFDLGYKSARLSERGIPHKTGLIVSKAIDFMSINTRSFGFTEDVVDDFLDGIGLKANEDRTVPLRYFLGTLADNTYFTIPASSSFDEVRKQNAVRIKKFNISTIELIEEDLLASSAKDINGEYQGSGMLLAFAATGTTEKEVDVARFLEGQSIPSNYSTVPETFDPNDYDAVRVIGSINPKVAVFLRHCFTFASSIILGTTQSHTDVRPNFIIVESPKDIDALSDRVVETSSVLQPEVLFLRDVNGNLPLLPRI